jgi:beta-galactosidase
MKNIIWIFVSVFLVAGNLIGFSQTSDTIRQYISDISGTDMQIYSGHLKLGGINNKGEKIAINNYYLLMNDKPVIPVTGEFHFSRYPEKYWDESIRKMKAGGVNVIATYVFWIIHEEKEGIFDWAGDKNLRKFVELCAENNVKVIVRIGPFCHGEIRNGGLPEWLMGRPVNIRSNDPGYLKYVERLYNEIGKQLNGLLFKDGGPVFAIQLENEYEHSAAPWGITYPGQPYDFTSSGRDRETASEGASSEVSENPYTHLGNEHMKVLKSLAVKAGLEVPVYTATGWGNAAIIENESLPVTGAYAYPTWSSKRPSPFYLFTDLHIHPDYRPVRYKPEDYPYFAAEISGGIMVRYNRRPVVPPESLDALITRFLGSGTNGIGYYMFHGGSTPRGEQVYYSDEAYGYPKISYDFQSPVREYGQIRPSFNRLKLIHFFLNSFGNEIAPMGVVLPDNNAEIEPDNIDELRYAIRTHNNSGFVFMINFQDHIHTKDIENIRFSVKTSEGELSIPESSAFTLKSGENAIFPFNYNMEGINLNYATAQLLTKFRNNNEKHYVFFAPEDVEPEFSIDKTNGMTIKSLNCLVDENADRLLIKCDNNKPGQFTIIKSDGLEINVLVINKEYALKAWLSEITGNRYIIFTDALVLQDGKNIELYKRGKANIEFHIYPSLESIPETSYGKLESLDEKNDLFSFYKLILPEVRIDREVRNISDNKMAVTIPAEKPEGVNDIFLRINYLGDTGMAFIDGELVSDNFFYGTDWEIGLKRFMDRPDSNEMVFYFRPLYKDEPFYEDFAPELIPDFSQKRRIVKINNIRFIPEYKAIIQFNQ